MMLFNRKFFRNITLRTLPGMILGLIFFLFPIPGMPLMLLPLSFPIIFFIRALYHEVRSARLPTPAVVMPSEPMIMPKKIKLPARLLDAHEIFQFQQLIEQQAYPGHEDDKIKLQQYNNFFEKKDPLTGLRVVDLKQPVTVEGSSQNSRWTHTFDRPCLKKILFSKEVLNEKEQKLRNFLTHRANVVTHCYDGYPSRLYHFSVFVRIMLSKFKAPLQKPKNENEFIETLSLPSKKCRDEKEGYQPISDTSRLHRNI